MSSIFEISAPILLAEALQRYPTLQARVCAGFPSPAEDLQERSLSLDQILVTHPQATYLMRVRGLSMVEAGIFDNDLLVVNRALKPRHNHIVVAIVDGEFTVKYLHQRQGRIRLKAANPTYPDIVPRDGQTLEVWGVVTSSTRQFGH